jgi:hypothetical protein
VSGSSTSACVVSTGPLVLGDGDSVQATIAGQSLNLGSSVHVTGDALTSGNVRLGNQSTITGTLSYAGQLTLGSADSIGHVQHVAVPAPAIPTQTVTVGTQDLTVPGGATQTLSPGTYRAVNLGCRPCARRSRMDSTVPRTGRPYCGATLVTSSRPRCVRKGACRTETDAMSVGAAR